MKIKYGGSYVNANPFVKRGGVYQAPELLVKRGGAYAADSVAQRLTIVGSTIYDYDGVTPIHLRGVSFGAYLEDLDTDPALYASWGANVVRFVAPRWWGPYGDDIEARDNSSPETAFINPVNLAYIDNMIGLLHTAGLKVQLAFDSDCGQNGQQDPEYCMLNGVEGCNFWTNPEQFTLFISAWQFMLAGGLRNQPDIIECMPEPANPDGAVVKETYRQIMDGCLAVRPDSIFVIGTTSYAGNSDPEEVYFADRTNIIYTKNLLSGSLLALDTLQDKIAQLLAVRAAHNVPVIVQQLGVRTGDDTDFHSFNAGHSLMNALGVHFQTWQNRQNTVNPDEYANFYKDGVGGWTEKVLQTARFQYYMTQTYAALEAAAISAATAASAVLFYVKADLSNVFQDSAGTTPVTADGQPCGLVNPAAGAGLTLLQSSAAVRPVITTIAATGRRALLFDGVNTYMNGSSAFFSSGSQMTAIGAGIPANTNVVQDFVYAGASSGTVKWPRLAASAAKVANCVWQTDTTTNTVTGLVGTAAVPIVISCTRDGSANKILYSNGVQDGATNSTADGTIASLTRLRVGGSSTNSPSFIGPIALICVATTAISAANRQAIERFGAFLAGAYYQV